MKRIATLLAIVALGGAALFLAERRHADADVSPRALLHFLGDTQRELTRLPASATRLSDEDEVRIGQELARRYEYQTQDPQAHSDAERDAVQQYVSRVGARVAVRAHRKLPYSFHYIPDPHFVNAFALPGGPVFIGAGLMSLMDSEDELASVLGHEVEHIDHYHCAERVQVEERTRGLGLTQLLVELPIAVFEAGYTKEQELQADSEGTRLAVMAGYSPLGSIRMFEAFDRAYRDATARKATSPQEELANVALQTIEDYFRSHPPSAERADRIRSLMDSEHWPASAERDLEVGWVFWSERAADLLTAHKYEAAQVQAERALKLKPGHMKALWTLSQARLKQGDFAAAAAAVRQMLDQEPHSANLAYEYAHALAGDPNHAGAAREFQEWLSSKTTTDPLLPVAAAGLNLLAGDDRPAQALVNDVRARSVDTGQAQRLGYLGWWYYLAGRYNTSADLLTQASNMLPGDAQYRAGLGWTDVELRNYAAALSLFRLPRFNTPTFSGAAAAAYDSSTVDAGLAVALWLGEQRSEAVSQFERVYDEYPEWRNPRWVRGMYSPTVWRTISQISAEIDRERKEKLRASGHPVAD